MILKMLMICLIEDEKGETRKRGGTDGKEKQDERGVMDRVSSKKTPLMGCTNTMKLKIEQNEEGRKLHTKEQWKRMARMVCVRGKISKNLA